MDIRSEDGDGYTRFSESLWGLARADYLAGASGKLVCERYGMKLPALRARAEREGWRRSDHPVRDPAFVEEEYETAEEPPLSRETSAALAWTRASRAIAAGRLAEAQGWTRLWRQLDQAAGAEEREITKLERLRERTGARLDDLFRTMLGPDYEPDPAEPAESGPAAGPSAEIDSVDSFDSFSPAAPPPEVDSFDSFDSFSPAAAPGDIESFDAPLDASPGPATAPAMPEITIRQATEADAEALASLGARTFTEAFGHLYPKADLDDFLAANHTRVKCVRALNDPDTVIFVAEQDGASVGYAQAGPADMPHPELRPEHGELKRFYILRSHQNLGLGAHLIEPALAWLEARGRTPIWISVWSQNHCAQRFYARRGFEKVGEYEFAVGGWRDPEFIYRRG